MKRETWELVESIYQRAMDLPEGERTAFVRARCAEREDAEQLEREVLSLIRASDPRSDFLETPATDVVSDHEDTDRIVGTSIGAFEVVRRVGVGGMGAVYEGRRADGEFEQRVAIKVLRHDLGGAEAKRRFAHERQTLARLEHPGIARLIDGGTLGDGRPYLAMEFVEGERLDRHCDKQELGIEARLQLFMQAAEAVQHAHRNLVIHRDLKPSNILVDAQGRVRVIDFGIALPLYLQSGETMVTEARDILGTLAYMSPEQCRRGAGADLDVRSDVYSLGVVLYQLLTGTLPHDVSTMTLVAAIQEIAEATPQRPAAHDARLRGDLESIVLKAMEPEPDRRYASAEALVQDLKRFLRREPVRARPRSRGYLARKFVERHRWPVVGASAALVLIVATSVAAVTSAVREAAAAARAEEQRAVAAAVGQFLDDLLTSPNPYAGGDRDTRVVDLLERARAGLDEIEEPEVEIELCDLLGRTYWALGDFEASEELITRGLALLESRGETDSKRYAMTLASLTITLHSQGRFEETLSRAVEAVESLRVIEPGSPAIAEVEVVRAVALDDLERNDEAVEAYERALVLCEERLGPTHGQTLLCLYNFGDQLVQRGEYARGVELERRAYDGYLDLHPQSPLALLAGSGLAAAHVAFGEPSLALSIIEPTARDAANVHGEDHPQTALARLVHAEALCAPATAERAIEMATGARESLERALGAESEYTLWARRVAADAMLVADRSAEALRLAERVSSDAERVIPTGSIELGRILVTLGACRAAEGDCAGAVDAYERAAAAFRATGNPDHPLAIEAETRSASVQADCD